MWGGVDWSRGIRQLQPDSKKFRGEGEVPVEMSPVKKGCIQNRRHT